MWSGIFLVWAVIIIFGIVKSINEYEPSKQKRPKSGLS